MLSKKDLEVLREAVENYNEKDPQKMKGLSGSLQKAKEVVGADKSAWAPYTHILELYEEIERLNG